MKHQYDRRQVRVYLDNDIIDGMSALSEFRGMSLSDAFQIALFQYLTQEARTSHEQSKIY